MAKFTITHKCGHESTKNITGKVSKRQSTADWHAEQNCWACQCANESSRAIEKNSGLPALKGSEKQIAWAEVCRAKGLESLRDYLDDRPAHLSAILDWCQAKTESRWWIDHNEWYDRGVIREAATAGAIKGIDLVARS